MANRTYTEKEVLALLRQAASYHANDVPASSSGLAEEQVRAMAIDLGISPEAIDMAMRTGAEKPKTHWIERAIGAPISPELDITTEGEVDAEMWAEFIHTLRKRFGMTGNISTVGKTYDWTTGDAQLMAATVSATGKAGRTRFRVTSDGWGALFLSTFPLLLFVGFMGWDSQPLLIRLGAVILGMAAYYGIVMRMLIGGMFARRQQAILDAAEEFKRALAESDATTHLDVVSLAPANDIAQAEQVVSQTN